MSQTPEPVTDLLPVQTLGNIKENKSSKREKKKDQIVNYVVNDVKKIPNLNKVNLAWIQRACELIENMVKKKDKIDKWSIMVKIFNTLFAGASPTDMDVLKSHVEHMLDNKLIKKVARHIMAYSFVRKVFISNFLFRGV